MINNERKWTRGDARAEIARVLDGTKEARKTLHAAMLRIHELGVETGFKEDAARVLEQLREGTLGESEALRVAHAAWRRLFTAPADSGPRHVVSELLNLAPEE
jgi:hypothetical protein